MKKTANIFLIIFSMVLFQNCDEDQFESSLEYVSFGDTTYSTGVNVGGSTTIDVTVFTSKIVSSDVTFGVVVDPSSNAAVGSYEVPSSVTVPSGSNEGTFTVALSDVNLGIGINKIVLNFENVAAGYGNGGLTTVEYIQNCTEVTVTLDFVFDFYSEETGWNIKDALGGVVASKGSGSYSGQSSASEIITLCQGRNYTLTITDAFGDGMFDGANNGTYTLTFEGNIKASGGGDFGSSESTAFDTN